MPVIIYDTNSEVYDLIRYYEGDISDLLSITTEEQLKETLQKHASESLIIFQVCRSDGQDIKSINDQIFLYATNPTVLALSDQSEYVSAALDTMKFNDHLALPLDRFRLRGVFEKFIDQNKTNFNFKQQNVLIVDSSDGVRPVISTVLRGMGLKSILTAAGISEALNTINKTKIDWIISSVFSTDDITAFQLLLIRNATPSLKNTLITLLVNDHEYDFMPKAFDLGAFSWIRKPLTKASVQKEFKDVMQQLSALNGNPLPISSSYLRRYLTGIKHFQELISYDRAMLEIYKDDPNLLLNLAESKFLAGHPSEASVIAYETIMIDPTIKDKAMALIDKYSSDDQEPKGDYKLEVCLIIDPDEAVINSIEQFLKKIGAKTIHSFKNGEDCYSWLQSTEQEPSLIIMEWKIPLIPGPFLIQKIRLLNFISVPIIICSSLITESDQYILQEIGVSQIIKKPIMDQRFIATVIRVLQEHANPTQWKTIEQKIREHIKAKSLSAAKKLVPSLLQENDTPKHVKFLVRAEIKFLEGAYSESQALITKALAMTGDNIHAINLLGKCLLQNKDYKSAIKCFKAADKISPRNIERLCNIAITNSEMGDESEAQNAIDEVVAIDDNLDIVKETKVNCALNQGATQIASDLMASMDSVSNVISYMNNQAVALSREGDYNESIDIYRNTIGSIPEKHKELKPIIFYNLSLALTKQENYDEAMIAIKQSTSDQSHKIFKKAASLEKKLIKAKESGQIQLNIEQVVEETTKEVEVDAPNLDQILQDPQHEIGDLCLHGIYLCNLEIDETLKAILKLPLPDVDS